MTHAIRLGRFGLLGCGAVVIGFGIPIVWLLIAAEVQGASGVRQMTTATAATIFPGIALSYALVLGAVRRLTPRGEGQTPRRGRSPYPWLRSMRDEPARPATSTPIETMFMVSALLVSVAFTVWFFLWAGNPLPPA